MQKVAQSVMLPIEVQGAIEWQQCNSAVAAEVNKE